MEAVPNLSEGRDLSVVEAAVEAVLDAGAEVLDWSADAAHNRSVLTLLGAPDTLAAAAMALAGVVVERIDLRRHEGLHPRVGALDVLPFVPILGATMDDARRLAWRVGDALAREFGLPVYYYAEASRPPGRRLADLRRGGFEALAEGWPASRVPDVAPAVPGRAGAHPSAGVVCVGARPLLLAWNVKLRGLGLPEAGAIASAIRESGGGFTGVRALAFDLKRGDAVQLSMNIEDLEVTDPMDVYRRIEELVASAGGEVGPAEVIGMLPDRLLLGAAAERLGLGDVEPGRALSARVLEGLARDWVAGEPSH
jgi:glutamate formiminotransferase